jgi:hypothetical protein
MSQETYEECLEKQLDEAVNAHHDRVVSCMEYLKVITMYSKRIKGCDTIEEVKEWVDRMIDHALQVK